LIFFCLFLRPFCFVSGRLPDLYSLRGLFLNGLPRLLISWVPHKVDRLAVYRGRPLWAPALEPVFPFGPFCSRFEWVFPGVFFFFFCGFFFFCFLFFFFLFCFFFLHLLDGSTIGSTHFPPRGDTFRLLAPPDAVHGTRQVINEESRGFSYFS